MGHVCRGEPGEDRRVGEADGIERLPSKRRRFVRQSEVMEWRVVSSKDDASPCSSEDCGAREASIEDNAALLGRVIHPSAW